jgi:4-aminobutyrate aminotransferase-like enzyme
MGDVYPSEQKVELIDFIISQLPENLSKGALACTGSQAVELALKTAILKTSVSNFIAFDGAYHGLDIGTLPFTHRSDFKAPFQGLIPHGLVSHLPFGCDPSHLSDTIYRLKNKGSDVAGIILEPIQ